MTPAGKMIYHTKNIIDGTVEWLKEMQNFDTLDHWISYLLEAIETELGEDALKETKRILDKRFENGRW